MSEKAIGYQKPLVFVAGAKKAAQALPPDVQDVFGYALMAAQFGDTVPRARPFGEGVPREVLKLVASDDSETYRAAFVVAFAGVVYVLDVFQKKSKSGKATPQADLDRVTARYRAAVQDYAAKRVAYLAATAVAKAEAIAKDAMRETPVRKHGKKK